MPSLPIHYIEEKNLTASTELAYWLRSYIRQICHPWNEIVFLCIGSDRVTGDSLGPLIGRELSRYQWKDMYIYGTIFHPVHAMNLEYTWTEIKKKHPMALFIAIDASLGSEEHIGFITVGMGALQPGSGVQKNLPEIGDIFITGILNAAGAFEHLLLQTTSLSTVMQMAETISDGIIRAFLF